MMLQGMKWLENAAKKLPLSPQVSRANRTALLGHVWALLTTENYPGSSCVSFAKLDQNGSWVKMYQGYYQVTMDGFSDEYLESWPSWGMMQDGVCGELPTPGWSMSAKDYALLPTPIASDGMAWLTVGKDCLKTLRHIFQKKGNPSKHLMYLNMLLGHSATQTAEFYEMMMGFPPHWTDLSAVEMP